MSSEGFRPPDSSANQSEQLKNNDVESEVAAIEDDYDYFAGSGSYGMKGRMWNYIPGLPEHAHVVDLNSQGGDLALFASDFSVSDKIYIVDENPRTQERKYPELLERSEITLSQQSPTTFEPLEPVDLVMANTLLRRVPPEQKLNRIKHIYSYLKKGGKLLWSDIVRLDDEQKLAEAYAARKRTIEFSKHSAEAAEKFFEKERQESYPLSIHEMLEVMHAAGFTDVEEIWHEGMFALVVGTK